MTVAAVAYDNLKRGLMTQRVLALVVLLLVSNIVIGRDLPDRTKTPGVANPDVTQANIQAIAADWVVTYKKYVNRKSCPPLEHER